MKLFICYVGLLTAGLVVTSALQGCSSLVPSSIGECRKLCSGGQTDSYRDAESECVCKRVKETTNGAPN